MVDKATRRSKSWPAAPNVLSNTLKRLAPALREVGIEYEEPRPEGRAKKWIKTLREIPEETVRAVRTGAAGGADGALSGGRCADLAGDEAPTADGDDTEDRPSGTTAKAHASNGAVDAGGLLPPSSEGSSEEPHEQNPRVKA